MRGSSFVQLEKTQNSSSSFLNECLHFCWETLQRIYKWTQHLLSTDFTIEHNIRLLIVRCDKIVFLVSTSILPASHDLSISLKSFLGLFFGEKLNKSFPRVSSCIVCNDGYAIFHNLQIWKVKQMFFPVLNQSENYLEWQREEEITMLNYLKKTQQCHPQWR